MFEDEEWARIAEEHVQHYLVSTHGRVKHQDRMDQARKLTINDKGFPVVVLYSSDSKTRYLRHVNLLVANAFLPKTLFEDENTIWHIDGDLTNCHVDNLRWETRWRVLQWNEMNRLKKPRLVTPRVKNNRTGVIYDNAFECAMAESKLETDIVWRVEQQALHDQDDNARYRYIYEADARSL